MAPTSETPVTYIPYDRLLPEGDSIAEVTAWGHSTGLHVTTEDAWLNEYAAEYRDAGGYWWQAPPNTVVHMRVKSSVYVVCVETVKGRTLTMTYGVE